MEEHWPHNYQNLSMKPILENYDAANGETRLSHSLLVRWRGLCKCEQCKWARQVLFGKDAIEEPEMERSSMAVISVCDRCTSLVKGIALGSMAIQTSSDSTGEVIRKELCPECVREILELTETEVPPREVRAFDKPYIRPKEKSGGLDDASAEELAKEFIKRMSETKKELGQ